MDKYITIIETNENPASTRGYSLALGYLPKKLLVPSPTVLDSVMICLCKKAHFNSKVGGEKDAGTRRNALIALRRASQTVGTTYSPNADNDVKGAAKAASLNPSQVAQVFDAFLLGLRDYNVDRRGDVGSWCRIEAMRGLEAMTLMTVEEHSDDLPEYFSKPLCTSVICALLKQFSEKLDSARVEAGKCLQRILCKEPEIPCILERQKLQECLGLIFDGSKARNTEEQDEVDDRRDTNWADASLTFPMLARVMDIPDYFPAIMAGMVISVGGLTESVAKHSSAALLQWVKDAKGSRRMNALAEGRLPFLLSRRCAVE